MSNINGASTSSVNTKATTTATSKSTRNQPKYQEGEKVFCFHGALIYEAKCLKIEKETSRGGSNDFLYFIHYNGWSKNWDEWVPHQRILKYNSDNIKRQKELIEENKALNNKKAKVLPAAKNGECETQLKNQSKAPNSNVTLSTNDLNSKKRKLADVNYTNNNLNGLDEKNFNSINDSNRKLCTVDITVKHKRFIGNEKLKIQIPECLKEWLIDDFDLIIHQNKILQLPGKYTVSSILKDYHDQKNEQYGIESILNEIISDLLEYFNSMLGSQLLYKFERLQYTEILKMNKNMSDIYGPMHLLRLFERLKQMLEFAPLDDNEPLEKLIYYTNDILKYLENFEKRFFDENNYILAPPFYVRSSI